MKLKFLITVLLGSTCIAYHNVQIVSAIGDLDNIKREFRENVPIFKYDNDATDYIDQRIVQKRGLRDKGQIPGTTLQRNYTKLFKEKHRGICRVAAAYFQTKLEEEGIENKLGYCQIDAGSQGLLTHTFNLYKENGKWFVLDFIRAQEYVESNSGRSIDEAFGIPVEDYIKQKDVQAFGIYENTHKLDNNQPDEDKIVDYRKFFSQDIVNSIGDLEFKVVPILGNSYPLIVKDESEERVVNSIIEKFGMELTKDELNRCIRVYSDAKGIGLLNNEEDILSMVSIYALGNMPTNPEEAFIYDIMTKLSR